LNSLENSTIGKLDGYENNFIQLKIRCTRCVRCAPFFFGKYVMKGRTVPPLQIPIINRIQESFFYFFYARCDSVSFLSRWATCCQPVTPTTPPRPPTSSSAAPSATSSSTSRTSTPPQARSTNSSSASEAHGKTNYCLWQKKTLIECNISSYLLHIIKKGL